MNTTDEIMTLVSTYADAASEAVYEDLQLTSARRALITAIDQLVEQAAWAHHHPALLTEADAAADLAGVARPGAELVDAPYMMMTEAVDLVLSDPDTKLSRDAVRTLQWLRTWVSVPLYTAPPQASQPAQEAVDADTERMNWLETMTVNVRTHLRYGSHNLFWASPEDGDGDPPSPSDLRRQIDAVRAAISAKKGGAA